MLFVIFSSAPCFVFTDVQRGRPAAQVYLVCFLCLLYKRPELTCDFWIYFSHKYIYSTKEDALKLQFCVNVHTVE